MLQKDFDISKFVIATNTKEKLSELTENELDTFDGLILYDIPKELSSYEKRVLNSFNKKGGKVIHLTFYSRYFDDIRFKNRSLFTEEPAEDLSVLSKKHFSEYLQSFPDKSFNKNIQIIKDTPELREIIVTIEKPSLLRIASSYFPGWKAYIDGKKTPIYMSDGMNTAIPIVSKGRHRVTFVYRPFSFYSGAILTFITIMVLGSSVILVVKNKKIN